MNDVTKTGVKRVLLIVDDDVEWTDLLLMYFSPKYSVMAANSAEAALEMIAREMPQVMILDLVMPSVDGFGLLNRLRESPLFNVRTILTTGWSSPDLEDCAAEVGCKAVLSKPISLTELDRLVFSLMEDAILEDPCAEV